MASNKIDTMSLMDEYLKLPSIKIVKPKEKQKDITNLKNIQPDQVKPQEPDDSMSLMDQYLSTDIKPTNVGKPGEIKINQIKSDIKLDKTLSDSLRNTFKSSFLGMAYDLDLGQTIGQLSYHTYADIFNKPVAPENKDAGEIIKSTLINFANKRQAEEKYDPTTWYGKTGKFVVSGVFDTPLYLTGGVVAKKVGGTVIKKVTGENVGKGIIELIAEKKLTTIANNATKLLTTEGLKTAAKATAVTSIEGAGAVALERLVKSPLEQIKLTDSEKLKMPKVSETAKEVAVGAIGGAIATPIIGSGVVIGSKVLNEALIKPTFSFLSKFLPKHVEQYTKLDLFKNSIDESIPEPEFITAKPGEVLSKKINEKINILNKTDSLKQKWNILDKKIENVHQDALNYVDSKLLKEFKNLVKKRDKLDILVAEDSNKLINMKDALINKGKPIDNVNVLKLRYKIESRFYDRLDILDKIKLKISELTGNEKLKFDLVSKTTKDRLNNLIIQKDLIDKEFKSLVNDSFSKKLLTAEKYGLFTNERGFKPSDFLTARGVIVDPDVAFKLNELPSYKSYFKNNEDGTFIGNVGNIVKSGLATIADFSNLMWRDVIRTTEKIDGVSNGYLFRTVVEPIINSRSNAIVSESEKLATIARYAKSAGVDIPPEGILSKNAYKVFDNITSRIKGNLSNESKIKLLWNVIDGKASQTGVNQLTPEMVNLVSYVRNDLKLLHTKINESNEKMNLPLIGEIKDYQKHIRDFNFAQEMGFTYGSNDIKTGIIGVNKKTIGLGGSEKVRTGSEDIIENPFNAYVTYIRNATKLIEMNESAQVVRSKIKFLNEDNKSYFNKWLDNAMGGLSDLDMVVQGTRPGKVYLKFVDWLQNRIGKSIVAGNINIAAQQPTTSGFTYAHTNAASWLSAAKKMVESPFESESFVYANSPMYRARVAKKSIDADFKVSELMSGNKINFTKANPLYWVTEASSSADRLMFQHSFLAAFKHGKSYRYMSDKQAIAYANTIAIKSQNLYDRIFLSPAFRSKSLNPLTQLQSFASNLMQQMTHDPQYRLNQKQLAWDFVYSARMVGAMVASNIVYKSATGLTPFNIPFLDMEGGDVDIKLSRKPGDIIPMVSGLSRYGSPAAIAIPEAVMKIMSGDDSASEEALKTLKRNAPLLLNYGLQLKRTYEGYEAVSNGYVKKGRKEIPIEGQDKIIAPVFGVSKTKEVQEYYEKR